MVTIGEARDIGGAVRVGGAILGRAMLNASVVLRAKLARAVEWLRGWLEGDLRIEDAGEVHLFRCLWRGSANVGSRMVIFLVIVYVFVLQFFGR